MIIATAKVSEEVNAESQLLGTRWFNSTLTLSTTMHSITDGQTDDIMKDIDDCTTIGYKCTDTSYNPNTINGTPL